MKVPAYPSGIEREYNRAMQAYVKKFTKLDKRLTTLKLDGFSEDLNVLLIELVNIAQALANSLRFKLPDLYAKVSKWNDKEWVASIKSRTGVQLANSRALPATRLNILGSVSNPLKVAEMFGEGVDVLRSEPWMLGRMNNWIDYNTALIKSIPEQHFAAVEAKIRNGIMTGVKSEELAKQIQEISGVTAKRAELIAVDQIAKANADLTQQRMRDLGIGEYEWLTRGDEKVRPTHAANNGKIYSWNNPSDETGHPGSQVRCRCTAIPVFKLK